MEVMRLTCPVSNMDKMTWHRDTPKYDAII